MPPKNSHLFLTWKERLKNNSKEKCSNSTRKKSWKDKSIRMKSLKSIRFGAKDKSQSTTSKTYPSQNSWASAIHKILISHRCWAQFINHFSRALWLSYQLLNNLKQWVHSNLLMQPYSQDRTMSMIWDSGIIYNNLSVISSMTWLKTNLSNSISP